MAKKKRGIDRDAYRALILGPAAASFKKQASAKQWNSVKKQAHKRGLSVEQFLRNQNVPRPLQELGKKQIESQAAETIRKAYAPAFEELSSREKRLNALNDKRKADNEFYANWIQGKLTQFEADAAERDQKLGTTAREVQDRQRQLWEQANQDLRNRDAARGTTDLPGGPTDLQVAGGFAQQGVGVQAGQATANIAAGATHRDYTRAAVTTQSAARDAQRQAEHWAALSEVANERLKAKTAQGADIAKEISRLLDQEISKAQYNQQYAAAAQKLDLDVTEEARKAGESRSKARDRSRRFKLDEQKAKDAVNKAAADRQLKDDEFSAKYGVSRKTWRSWGDKQKQNYLKRARARGVIGSKGDSTSKPKKPPTRDERQKGLNVVNNIRNVVARLSKWQRYIRGGGSPPPGVMQELRASFNAIEIDAALDVLRYNGLSPDNARALIQELRGTGVKSPWKAIRPKAKHPRT